MVEPQRAIEEEKLLLRAPGNDKVTPLPHTDNNIYPMTHFPYAPL